MLFFETSSQAILFLTTIPAGILLALLLSLSARARRWGPLWDILLMLTAGLAFFVYQVFRGETGLHLYQLLALAIGFGLYGRIFQAFAAMRKKKRENSCAAGRKQRSPVETIQK